MTVKLMVGDCRAILPTLAADSIDACVTDPPYGLEFMGKEWDRLDADLPQENVWKGRRGKGGSDVDTRPAKEMFKQGVARVNYGAKKSAFKRCIKCGKRQFSGSPCQCAEPEWQIEYPDGAPSSMIRMQRWHESWAREVYRVLKPGGHMLCFGGTRTHHRLMVALEDAGFEIRDVLMWLYGSGFPKSLDVSKALDKADAERHERALPITRFLKEQMHCAGLTKRDLNRAVIGADHDAGSAQSWTTVVADGAHKPRVPTWDQWQQLKALIGFDDRMDDEVWRLNGRKGKPGEAWDQREVIGQTTKARSTASASALPTLGASVEYRTWNETTSATDLARQWDGWGTALKPAYEPIILARKPLRGSVAANVTAYSVGALNIDGCRIGTHDYTQDEWTQKGASRPTGDVYGKHRPSDTPLPTGRWPANVLLSHHPDCVEVGTKRVKSGVAVGRNASAGSVYGNGRGLISQAKGDDRLSYADADGMETVAAWQCHPDCVVALLDAQSGESSSRERVGFPGGTTFGGGEMRAEVGRWYGDTGGASRFFKIVKGDDECERANVAVSDSTPSAGINDSVHRPASAEQTDGISTNKTPSASKPIETSDTPTTPHSVPVSLPGFEPVNMSNSGHVRSAETHEPTGIMTTTGDRSTSGSSVENVTSPSTSSNEVPGAQDSRNESRLFYTAKSSRAERNKGLGDERNGHPTVKSLDLMQWLVRLVTPKGGTVLDPFAGSGTTGIAADREGMHAVLIEQDAEYARIAERRIRGDAPLFATVTME